jgi:hypothetical protein
MHKGSFLLLSLMICVPALAQQAGEQERNKQIARYPPLDVRFGRESNIHVSARVSTN